jgi:hypothetical protein
MGEVVGAGLLAHVPTIMAQAEAGFTTFCIKPSQFTDEPRDVGRLCWGIIRRVDRMLG